MRFDWQPLFLLACAFQAHAASPPMGVEGLIQSGFPGCEAGDAVGGRLLGRASSEIAIYVKCSETQKGRLLVYSARGRVPTPLMVSPDFAIDRLVELRLKAGTGKLHVRVAFNGEPVETLVYRFAAQKGRLRVAAVQNEITYNGEPPPGQPIHYTVQLDLTTGKLFDSRTGSTRSMRAESRALDEFDPWEDKGLGVR